MGNWRKAGRAALFLPALILALALWAVGDCRAEAAEDKSAQATTQEQADNKQKINLEDMQVLGKADSAVVQSTSATVLDNEQIVGRVYVTPMDMLKLSPGVSISQYHQGGVVPAVQMRGFSTVGHSRDGAIALNGVPLNTLDNADTNVIIPLEVESIEVVKGPSSPFFGNFNSAGSIGFNTYQSGDFTRAKLSYGSFNTQDAAAVIARGDGKLDQIYSGEVYHTDGYQDNCDWDKQIASGRWNYRFTDQFQAGMGLRFYNTTWDSAGYIPQSVYDSNPQRAVSDVNGGWRKWGLVDGHADYALTDASKLKFLAWYTQEDWNRWQQNWISPAQKVGSNYGTQYQRPREAFGSSLAYHYNGQVLERDTGVVFGVSWQREFQEYRYWNMVVGNGRNKGSMTQDDELTLYTTALYGQVDYRVLKPLRLIVGARYDMMNGELDSKLTPANSGDRNGPEIFSPKLGLIYTVCDGWDLFANYAQGFALPGGPEFVSRSYLEPAIRTQYEAGLRANPNGWSSYILSIWRLDTKDDFQPTLADPNKYENAGETRREGVEVGADFLPWKALRLHVDYAYIHSEYLSYVSGGKSYDGNELPSVPNNIFNAEIAWAPPQGLGARLNYRLQSEWNIAADNIVKADGFDVVCAQVSYKFNKRYTLALDVINLFDRKYSEYLGSANGQLTYAPADPLSAYLTLTIDW
ncbi:TonB-dependent receptor [Desulfarculus baarsii]